MKQEMTIEGTGAECSGVFVEWSHPKAFYDPTWVPCGPAVVVGTFDRNGRGMTRSVLRAMTPDAARALAVMLIQAADEAEAKSCRASPHDSPEKEKQRT